MDHHGPLGRLPLRIGLTGLLVALTALLASGCGDDGSVLEAPTIASTTTTTVVPATPAPTTTSTTTTSSTTTTTTLPLEPWQSSNQAYYFPVQPPDVAAYSGSHHDYPATDIFAPTGSLYVAVTDGVIDELRSNDPYDPATDDPAIRGGRFVSLIGDDGVRYYCSHLDSVVEDLETGDRVAAGQVLGTIGNSGDAAPTSPHCHFGISRPTGAGDWAVRRGEVWPYEYLQAWTRGDDLTPVLPEG